MVGAAPAAAHWFVVQHLHDILRDGLVGELDPPLGELCAGISVFLGLFAGVALLRSQVYAADFAVGLEERAQLARLHVRGHACNIYDALFLLLILQF